MNIKSSTCPGWKDIFNSDKKIPMWGVITAAAQAAHECGYEYFVWNGHIIRIVDSNNYSYTDFTIKDIK